MNRKLTTKGIILGIIVILALLAVFINNRLNLSKEEKVMAGFEALMDREDITAAELIQYIDGNITAISKEKAVALVKGLERVQQEILPEWQKRFENDALQMAMAEVYRNNGWSLDNFDNIHDNDLKGMVEEAVSNGFKVETAEGFFFPVIDYALYDKYHEAVTPDLAAYFEIMAVESDQTPVKDAALLIEWDEILSRAARQEEFIEEYNTSPQVKAVKELLKRYVTFALFGANNTPLFSYDNGQMVARAKEAYLKHTWNEENGSFSTVLKEYLQVLEENDYRLTQAVDQYRKDAVSLF